MQTNFNSNSFEESLPNNWINWCRLCAKDDEQHNIKFLLKSNKNDENKKLSLQEALKKYFNVETSSEDSLPKKLCQNCLSMISSIINYSERVERVQRMFSHLAEMQKFSSGFDLNTIRMKFNIAEYDSIPIQFTSDGKNSSVLNVNESSKHSSNEDEHEVQIKEEENIESIMAMDYDKYLEKDFQKEEFLSDDNISAPWEDDPFENDSKGAKLLSKGDIREAFLQPPPNINVPLVENPRLERSKKKRKKFQQFTSKECLKKKRIVNDIKMETTCKECGNNFSKYMLYREHMQQTHNHSESDKHWPCPICDKTLLSLSNLERHVRIHVPLEIRQPFKCTDCDNRYTSKAQLETHFRYKHKNEKSFICEECGLCLRTNSNLRQHMLIHTDLEPYECDVCKKKFKSKIRLKRHMDTHSPIKYVCNICGLQLNSRITLNRHFLVHSDQMQHKCDLCGKAFKRAKDLKTHLLLHTGLKPYSCDFCERTFANRSNCRSHMKKMHPGELALLEASGNKTYATNIPKLETLKAVTKAADNLTPVVNKSSGCFAFGKKPKVKDNSKIEKASLISVNKLKRPSTSLQTDNTKLLTTSPTSTPLDLKYVKLVDGR